MVDVGDWMDVDTLGRKRGIGFAGESDSMMLESVADCGELDGKNTTGSLSDKTLIMFMDASRDFSVDTCRSARGIA